MKVPTTDGWERLMELVGPTSKKSIGSLARDLGVLPQLVHKWLSRRQRPRIEHRMGLERVAGIPVDLWLTSEERTIAFGSEGESGSGGTVEHPGLDALGKVQFTELDEDIHVSEEIDAGGAT